MLWNYPVHRNDEMFIHYLKATKSYRRCVYRSAGKNGKPCITCKNSKSFPRKVLAALLNLPVLQKTKIEAKDKHL